VTVLYRTVVIDKSVIHVLEHCFSLVIMLSAQLGNIAFYKKIQFFYKRPQIISLKGPIS